jgi:hypothetical protein
MSLRYHGAPVLDRTKVMIQQSEVKRGVSIRSPGKVDIRRSSQIDALDMVNMFFTSSVRKATSAP